MRRLLLATLVLLAGCATSDEPEPWQAGRLVIGTGDTTGVFYQVGGGYADVVTAHLPGYEARIAPTAGAGDNLLRLAGGDVHLALTSADVATDAVRATGRFAETPPAMRALARLHLNYTHLIVRADTGITEVAGLKAHRVSTGAVNSSGELMALRMLAIVGLDPDRDIVRRSYTLPEATRAMLDGSIDAMFWSGGLPTVGIAELVEKAAGRVQFVPVDGLLTELERRHPDMYVAAAIPAEVYRQPAAVPTVAVANLLVVAEAMPDELAYQLTRLIFAYQDELRAVHPEWGSVDRATAANTDPVLLHPGAALFYGSQ